MAILSFSGDAEKFIGDFLAPTRHSDPGSGRSLNFQIFDERQGVILERTIKIAKPNPEYIEVDAFANFNPPNLSRSNLAYDWDAPYDTLPTLSEGIIVNSHFIAFHVPNNTRVNAAATIIFDTPIIGFIDSRDSDLTNDLFLKEGAPSYTTARGQTLEGLSWGANIEFRDYVKVTGENNNILELRWSNTIYEALRVLTLASGSPPPPPTPSKQTFTGTADNDRLVGTTGADILIGLAGNDVYIVNHVGDEVIEKPNEGTDTVRASISYTLPANVENLVLTGTDNINGTGNDLNNRITGNSGNNILNGGAGADILTGGAGTDIFVFQFGQSILGAVDRITDFEIGLDKIDLLSFGGAAMSAPIAFSRAADATVWNMAQMVNTVFADADGALEGNQPLGLNSAVLVQGKGAPFLIINDGVAGFQPENDLVINLNGFKGTLPDFGAIAVDQFFVTDSVAIPDPASIPDPGPIPNLPEPTIPGTPGNDQLIGTAGNDIFDGGLGADTFNGLGGEDTFVLRFGDSPATKDGADTIEAFKIGIDKIDLLNQGGQTRLMPTSLTRAADATVWNVAQIVNTVFGDANGALPGAQPLGVNSAALVKGLGNSSYLIINDGVPGLQSNNDILIRLNNLSGPWPDFGEIPVSQFFV